MIVFLNGEFVPEERAVVSVFDRSFRYGDGLFETMLAVNGKIFRWREHWERLERGAQFFKFRLPCPKNEMLMTAQELLRHNALTEGVLRLQLSRGTGPRGYASSGAETPCVVMSMHPAPPRPAPPWKLAVFPIQVEAKDRFQGHKTANRLVQVMAATHARETGADEALIVNTRGWIGEGSMSNLFWVRDGAVNTTQLLPSVLPGVTRAIVLELCRDLEIPVEQGFTNRDQLTQRCDGVFLTLTSRGIVEAESVDGKPLRRSLITRQLQEEFEALLQRECA